MGVLSQVERTKARRGGHREHTQINPGWQRRQGQGSGPAVAERTYQRGQEIEEAGHEGKERLRHRAIGMAQARPDCRWDEGDQQKPALAPHQTSQQSDAQPPPLCAKLACERGGRPYRPRRPGRPHPSSGSD